MEDHPRADPTEAPLPGSVTRLGPDSGGRSPGDRRYPHVHLGMGTGRPGDQARRPGLPWIGVFLLVLRGLLLIQRRFRESKAIGSVFVLAIGLALLIRWAVTRHRFALPGGDHHRACGPERPQQGRVKPGRPRDVLSSGSPSWPSPRSARPAVGGRWQAWIGGLLVLFGGVNLIQPQVGSFLIPIVLVVGGAVLVLGSMMAPGRTWRFPR